VLIPHFLRPVRLNHPYLIYNRIIFDTIGETSSISFGYYFNPTEYYPTSNPIPVLTRVGDGDWVIGVEPFDGHQYQI